VLATLLGSGSVVEYEGFYYHAVLFDRARRDTIRARRSQVRTLPPERYAALLARRVEVPGDRKEALAEAMARLYGMYFAPALWESTLLPARVPGYRPDILDALLAEGAVSWRIVPGLGLGFHPYDDIDWDAEPLGKDAGLEGHAKVVFDALLQRGASFMQRLSASLGGASPMMRSGTGQFRVALTVLASPRQGAVSVMYSSAVLWALTLPPLGTIIHTVNNIRY